MKNLFIRNSKASLFILILLISGGLSACEQPSKPPTTPPNVFITNPVDAPGGGPDIDVWPETHDANGYYLEITLVGGATDLEDRTLSGSQLVWKTNQAGVQPGGPGTGEQQLGTGNSITVKLYATCSISDHLITLTATDSNGLTSFISRLIRVNVLC